MITRYGVSGIKRVGIIRQAREQRPDLRILLITDATGVLGSATAGVPLLRKPFGPAELSQAVSQIRTHDAWV